MRTTIVLCWLGSGVRPCDRQHLEATGSVHGDDSALHAWQRGVSGVSAELGLTEVEHVAQVGA